MSSRTLRRNLMIGPDPKPAELIAADATTAFPWETVRDLLANARSYRLATVHPAGCPHVRPAWPYGSKASLRVPPSLASSRLGP
jgi:hypothetical protein